MNLRVRCRLTYWAKPVEPGSIIPSCPYHAGGCLTLEVAGGVAARETVEAQASEGVAP